MALEDILDKDTKAALSRTFKDIENDILRVIFRIEQAKVAKADPNSTLIDVENQLIAIIRKRI